MTDEGIDFWSIVQSFGQVPAAEARAAGKTFTVAEHVRGLVLAQLSSQRPWGPIAESLNEIEAIFLHFDPQALKVSDPRQLVSQIRAIRCGNRAIARQMESLPLNIATLERIAAEHGSIDAFVTAGTPDAVALRLAMPGPSKLEQVGYTLALEYLRNVGIEAVKPDMHVCRALSQKRLALIEGPATPQAAYRALMRLSREAHCSATYLDNVLWLFCAQDYGAICGSQPRCDVCYLRRWCNYPSRRGSGRQ